MCDRTDTSKHDRTDKRAYDQGCKGTCSAVAGHALLAAQIQAHRTWECSLDFQESYCNGDNPSAVSLTAMLKKSSKDYMFPECYVGAEAEERLVMEIKMAACLDGFTLTRSTRHD